MARRATHGCFAVCAPGLEALASAELRSFGIRGGHTRKGGVVFDATTRQLYLTNLWSRTVTRVLVRVASFRATGFSELQHHAADVPWDAWLADDVVPQFRVTSSSSRLYHTEAIAERLTEVAGASRHADRNAATEQLFVVRVSRDTVTISVDSSGESLHRRGWRQATARAPLRETLAAALLLAVGWDGSAPLVDPFCGSGTIAIEAACLARQLAPGRDRTFAFARWADFEPGTWASVAGEAARRARPAVDVAIRGTDRDAGAVDAARANAERAGVASDVSFERAALSDVTPPAGTAGWVLTNPPYGGRIGGAGDLRDLYARFGQVVRERFPDWSVGLLVADRALAGHAGLPFEQRLRSSNGGIPVVLLTAALRAPG